MTTSDLIKRLVTALEVELQNCELRDPKVSAHHEHCRSLIAEAKVHIGGPT